MIFREDYNDEKNLFVRLLCICLMVRLVMAEENSEAIFGIWEGHSTSEMTVNDDGEGHRWEYKADGTYVCYIKESDKWVPADDALSEYFEDGNQLCMRWIENGEEKSECWEITIDGDVMRWTAQREDENGNTFTASFEMNRVAE